MFYALCILSVAVFGFSAAETVPLPPITICKRNSVNYSKCLKAAIQEAWPQFVQGLPEFNFPSLDPLIFEFDNFTYDRGAVHGVANISNFIFVGHAKTRFLAVRSHFVDKVFRLEIDVQIPKIVGSGECDAVGTLGEFKMGGKGFFNLTMENLQGTWFLTGHVANDIWTVEHFHVAPLVQKMKLYFEDLFNGNKELNNLAMIFANEYWPTLYRVMLPSTAEVLDPWLCDLANRFFSKVSFKQIFP